MKEKYDVLFIHPRNYGISQRYLKLPSLELCDMAGVLRECGYTYKLLDGNIEDLSVDECISIVGENEFKIALIYSSELNHINAIKIAKTLKELNPEKLIGMNGMLSTFIYDRIIKQTNIDFVILHNGTYVLKDILDINCNIDDFDKVSNISFIKDNQIVKNNIEYEELKALPSADRELYSLGKYYKLQPEAIVRSSWGCPSKCAFCNKNVYSKFRIKDMQQFFDEIDVLLNYGYESFFFSDDTFAFSQKRLDEFYDYYTKGKYNFKWTSNLRVSDITTELISKMKMCGAYRVFVGIETVSAKSNTMVNKLQNVTNLIDKINILKECNIEFHASFIVGNPGDTKDDIENTIKFVKQIKPTLATFNKIKLFPGTPIFEIPEKYGIKYIDKYWFENPEWTEKQMVYTNELSCEDIDFYAKKMMVEMFNG